MNKPLIPQTQIPRPTKLLSGELCATRYERTDPKGRYQEAYPPPPSETLVSELGARPVPQSPVPTQQPNLGLLEALFAPAYAHAADTGGRQGHHALLLTELARATRPQVQLPVEARAADLGARGRFYALAQTQSVELNDRQALFASAYLPAANLGARRASSAPTQSQLSDRDARPALISTPSWR